MKSPVSSSAPAAVSPNGESFHWPDAVDHPRVGVEVALPEGTGTIEIELMPELAPKSVARFLELTRTGQYDGTTFHRVIPGFMIQGGDPNSRDQDPLNDGQGGDPTPIPDEFSAVPFERGVVALANRGHPGTSSSQFFIMHDANRGLDGQYNAFGRVVAGLEVIDAIAAVEIDSVGRWGPKDRPIRNVTIRRTTGIQATKASDSAGAGPRANENPGTNDDRESAVGL